MTLMRPAPALDGERWIDDGLTNRAWHEPPQRPAYPRHEPGASAVSGTASRKVHQVIDALCRSIPLDSAELADEFFPAHLPVALIDAVFRSRLTRGEPPAPIAERYCRHFGIARCRADRWEAPSVDEQETLGDLIRRFDDLGMDRISRNVFRSRLRFPGANATRAEYVLGAAQALQRIGIEVLQDVPVQRPAAITDALRPLPGADESTVRRLLMYTGDEDFVLGDSHVRRFVASAIGRRAVSADEAEDLVRQGAYELILSPRLLDREIWRYGISGTGVAKPPELRNGK